MKIFLLLSVILIILTLATACRYLPEKKGDVVVNVPAERPTPTESEVQENGMRLLQQSFNRCQNTQNKNLSYAFAYDEKDKRAYLLEVEKFTYEVIPRVPEPSPKEKADGLDWDGAIYVTAEITAKYDILNKRWMSTEEGAVFQASQKDSTWVFGRFPLRKMNGTWVCNECSKYTALDCRRVKQLLDETPRY